MVNYINKFGTVAEYASAKLDKPNVSYIVETDEVKFTPDIPLSRQYLTFVALEDCQFSYRLTFENTQDSQENSNSGLLKVSKTGNFLYSVDDGSTWHLLDSYEYETTPTIAAGEKVLFKGDGIHKTPDEEIGIGIIMSTGRFNVEGNAMSLYYGDDFASQTDLSDKIGAFAALFYENENLVSAENLVLPATTLADGCYNGMFQSCTNLTTAPELPATTLAGGCYANMFANCTSLTTAPELPATQLASYCYFSMFAGCTSLTTAPELPATQLAEDCYDSMFQGCTSLVTAPELPATQLADYCYIGMFDDCTSLTTAPELPATTLAGGCYSGMFAGCASLTTAPELQATTLAGGCYQNMFYNCTSLTTAPELPATTLESECYSSMFAGCSNLNYIKCLATDISANDCTTDWVNGVASSGTFVKNPSMSNWTSDDNGIPDGWTIEDA